MGRVASDVKADDLTIDLRDNTLTLSAYFAPVDNADEEEILVEYEILQKLPEI